MTKKKKPNIYWSDNGTYIVLAYPLIDSYTVGIKGAASGLQLTHKQTVELRDLLNMVLASE